VSARTAAPVRIRRAGEPLNIEVLGTGTVHLPAPTATFRDRRIRCRADAVAGETGRQTTIGHATCGACIAAAEGEER
jgi:hypothetical protein